MFEVCAKYGIAGLILGVLVFVLNMSFQERREVATINMKLIAVIESNTAEFSKQSIACLISSGECNEMSDALKEAKHEFKECKDNVSQISVNHSNHANL